MKKSILIFLIIAAGSFAAFAQAPQKPVEQASFSSIDFFNTQEFTPVVIIDDDELGVCISPNPANSYINITAAKNLSNKTFALIDYLGITRIRQVLASSGNTISVSSMNNGSYTWIITDCLNKKLASGSLVIQH